MAWFVRRLQVRDLVNKLKRRQLSAKGCAIETVEALKNVHAPPQATDSNLPLSTHRHPTSQPSSSLAPSPGSIRIHAVAHKPSPSSLPRLSARSCLRPPARELLGVESIVGGNCRDPLALGRGSSGTTTSPDPLPLPGNRGHQGEQSRANPRGGPRGGEGTSAGLPDGAHSRQHGARPNNTRPPKLQAPAPGYQTPDPQHQISDAKRQNHQSLDTRPSAPNQRPRPQILHTKPLTRCAVSSSSSGRSTKP